MENTQMQEIIPVVHKMRKELFLTCSKDGGFPSGPVVKTPVFHSRG